MGPGKANKCPPEVLGGQVYNPPGYELAYHHHLIQMGQFYPHQESYGLLGHRNNNNNVSSSIGPREVVPNGVTTTWPGFVPPPEYTPQRTDQVNLGVGVIGPIDNGIADNWPNDNNARNAQQNQQRAKTAKKPRRRVASVAQRRAANIRERRRMFSLNEGFDKLRRKVPTFAYEKRLSRIETLRLAVTYISFMGDLLSAPPGEFKVNPVKKYSFDEGHRFANNNYNQMY